MPDRPGTGEQPGGAYPVAYCAPGGRAAAEAILAARGQHAARMVEEPRLVGAGEPYVAAAECLDLMRMLPSRYEFTAPEPAGGWVRDYWMWGLRVNSPQLAVLTSVI